MTIRRFKLPFVVMLSATVCLSALSQTRESVLIDANTKYRKGDFEGCIKAVENRIQAEKRRYEFFNKSDLMFGEGGEQQYDEYGLRLIALEGYALMRLGRTNEAIDNLSLLSHVFMRYMKGEVRRADIGSDEDHQQFWAPALGALGWAYITVGRFSDANLNCEWALMLDTNSVSFMINRGHCFLQQGDVHRAEGYYDNALSLIRDDKAFNASLVSDLQMFIQKGWKRDLSSYELERLTRLFKKEPSKWNTNTPDAFQYYFDVGIDSKKAHYQDFSKLALIPIFHYLSEYRQFDYEDAASKNGKLNEFEFRRLKASVEANLTNANALGNEVPNRFVFPFRMMMPTSDYDFSSKSYRLDFRQFISKELRFDISNYKPNPALSTLYAADAVGKLELGNLPVKLSVEVVNDSVAEDWSKKTIICTIYFEVGKQKLQEEHTDKVSGLFEEYLRKKGYSSLSKVPKSNISVLEKSFCKETLQTRLYTRVYEYGLSATVKLIQIELPNQETITWLPR